jgi:hypothetical protein
MPQARSAAVEPPYSPAANAFPLRDRLLIRLVDELHDTAGVGESLGWRFAPNRAR